MDQEKISISQFDIDCTGDVCVGDEVSFERATFSGSFRNAKFAGMERIEGKIIADSYGEKSQQHTFTIEIEGGNKIRIKGRNLYRNGVKRMVWMDETLREKTLAEKHQRGALARKRKLNRMMGETL